MKNVPGCVEDISNDVSSFWFLSPRQYKVHRVSGQVSHVLLALLQTSIVILIKSINLSKVPFYCLKMKKLEEKIFEVPSPFKCYDHK